MSLFKDHYRTLGVARDASPDQIRAAYRKLALKYHPDLNKSPLAESRFKRLGEAYDVLKDPTRRAEYDDLFPPRHNGARVYRAPRSGAETRRSASSANAAFHSTGRQQASAQGGGFRQFFHDFDAGGGFPGRFRRNVNSVPGTDLEAPLALTLEEAFRGGSREVTLEMPPPHGRRTFQVKVPQGVLPGQKIRLKGQGEKGLNGGEPGDLFLVVEMPDHPLFRLEGRHLHLTVPITPWEAALGAKIQVETLDGTVLTKIPPGSSSGRKIRLRGKGFPGRTPEEGGDLLVTLRITVPERLTRQEEKLYRQLAELSRHTPRG